MSARNGRATSQTSTERSSGSGTLLRRLTKGRKLNNRHVSYLSLGEGDCKGWLAFKEHKHWVLKKWCVLKETSLYVYESKESSSADYMIILPSFRVHDCHSKRKFSFELKNAGTAFKFAGDSEQERRRWMNKLGLASIEFLNLPAINGPPVKIKPAIRPEPPALSTYGGGEPPSLSTYGGGDHQVVLTGVVSVGSSLLPIVDMNKVVFRAPRTQFARVVRENPDLRELVKSIQEADINIAGDALHPHVNRVSALGCFVKGRQSRAALGVSKLALRPLTAIIDPTASTTLSAESQTEIPESVSLAKAEIDKVIELQSKMRVVKALEAELAAIEILLGSPSSDRLESYILQYGNIPGVGLVLSSQFPHSATSRNRTTVPTTVPVDNISIETLLPTSVVLEKGPVVSPPPPSVSPSRSRHGRP